MWGGRPGRPEGAFRAPLPDRPGARWSPGLADNTKAGSAVCGNRMRCGGRTKEVAISTRFPVSGKGERRSGVGGQGPVSAGGGADAGPWCVRGAVGAGVGEEGAWRWWCVPRRRVPAADGQGRAPFMLCRCGPSRSGRKDVRSRDPSGRGRVNKRWPHYQYAPVMALRVALAVPSVRAGDVGERSPLSPWLWCYHGFVRSCHELAVTGRSGTLFEIIMIMKKGKARRSDVAQRRFAAGYTRRRFRGY